MTLEAARDTASSAPTRRKLVALLLAACLVLAGVITFATAATALSGRSTSHSSSAAKAKHHKKKAKKHKAKKKHHKKKAKKHKKAKRTTKAKKVAKPVATTTVPGKPVSGSASGRRPVDQLKIMNYYPATAGWTQMWSSFDAARIATDLDGIHALGANTVRVIVQPTVFGYPAVESGAEQHLMTFLALCRQRGMSVQLTLFDWFTSYSDTAGSIAWMKSLLGPIASDPTIALVELQNETSLTAPGAQSWIRTLFPEMKRLAPGIPATISISGQQTGADMATLDNLTSGALDVIDVHLYGTLVDAATALVSAAGIAGSRPIIVGETGRPTSDSPSQCLDATQARWFQEVAILSARFHAPSIAPWTYSDFTQGGMRALTSSASSQQNYGLYRTNGSAKPAAQVVRQIFGAGSLSAYASQQAATRLTAINKDTDFACAPSDNRLDNASPWFVFGSSLASRYGAAGNAGTSGGNAGYLGGTGGTDSMVPSLMQDFPVASSAPVTASTQVRLSSATGMTVVAIAWYRGSTYLGSNTSASAANGSAAWQSLSVTAAPPAGATTFQVHLKSGWNSGTAYFDQVGVTTG